MRNADAIPSVTIVLGPFGQRELPQWRCLPGRGILPDWLGCTAASRSPTGHRGPRELPSSKERTLAGNFMPFLPALAALSPAEIDAAEVKSGAIFALGETDIDDDGNAIHERHQVGVLLAWQLSFDQHRQADAGADVCETGRGQDPRRDVTEA